MPEILEFQAFGDMIRERSSRSSPGIFPEFSTRTFAELASVPVMTLLVLLMIDAGNFTGELDNWDRWFAKKMPGKDPIPQSPGYSRWNGWRAKPFAYDEELHPTAWVGRKAVKFIERQPMGNESGPQQQPFMLKVF